MTSALNSTSTRSGCESFQSLPYQSALTLYFPCRRNWFLGWYFTLAGILTIFTTFSTIVEYLTPRSISTRLPEYTVVVADRTSRLLDLKLPLLTLPVAPLALFVSYVYATQGHPWWANNLLAFTFAHSAIALMTLDSFLTGSVLLGGLFLYDCWWVFGSHLVAGSSVMVRPSLHPSVRRSGVRRVLTMTNIFDQVDVAKGLDAPIKLLFPKDLALSATKGFTMLGLGDIIIPGPSSHQGQHACLLAIALLSCLTRVLSLLP